ncbi:MAG TPA: hypothetical protein VLT87_11280 [Thermoanaerobaculia bacterium]|nr:hypothetical protein [Thermoanaerobaculia bacterium]
MAEWIITKHAVERYIERAAPGFSETAARAALRTAVHEAAPLRETTDRGDARWRTASGLILIVKREKGKLWVVTVLTEAEDAQMSDLERELIEEGHAPLPPMPKGVAIAGSKDAWIAHQTQLEARIKKLKARVAELEEAIAALKKAQSAPGHVAHLENQIRQLRSRGPRVKHLRHTALLQADKTLVTRALRAALKATRGEISLGEMQAYISRLDPGLLEEGFVQAALPDEDRDGIVARILFANGLGAENATPADNCGPECPPF